MDGKIKNIFLTGDIQVGKTTMIKRILRETGLRYGGFATIPYYKKDILRGFMLNSLNPQERNEAAAVIGYNSEGSWKAVPEMFDEFGSEIIRDSMQGDLQVIIMDELGFFESEAAVFQATVHACLDAAIPVLGVVKAKSTSFLDSVRARKDTSVLTVGTVDREMVYQQLWHEFNSILSNCCEA